MKATVKTAIAIVVVLAILLAAGLAVYAQRPLPGAGPRHLRIAYAMLLPGSRTVPHEGMLKELVSAFKAWYKERYGREIVVSVGYFEASELPKRLLAGRLRYDVWMGGHVRYLEMYRDLLLPYNSTAKRELNSTCWGCPLMDLSAPTPTWYAWCLYAICLLYDPASLPEPPKSWPELAADLRLENRVIAPDTAADPLAWDVALNIYLSEAWRLGNESLGWRSAWNISLRIWAMSEELASKPFLAALEVAAGQRAAILCSDVLAYHMILEAGHAHLRIAYLNGTLLRPCPVAVLKGAENEEEAKAFVDFLLSKEGQAIVAKHLMPVRPDVSTREPVPNPFKPGLPVIRAYNRTFAELGAEFVHDYHLCWLVKPHDGSGEEGRLRTAWWWVRRANLTASASQNATRYFRLAIGNLTRMCDYVKREDFDRIYRETEGWEEKGDYIDEWMKEAEQAYKRAVENARISVKAARATGTAGLGKATSSGEQATGLRHLECLSLTEGEESSPAGPELPRRDELGCWARALLRLTRTAYPGFGRRS